MAAKPTPWVNLPNAAVIDAILADARARPEAWASAARKIDAMHMALWWDLAANRVLDAMRDRGVDDKAGDLLLRMSRDSSYIEIRSMVWDAVSVLTTWDDSAVLLDLTPDALRTIIDTCEGDARHQAVLLLPAVIARSMT